MKWINVNERLPEKGFYTVRGLNNQGNPVEHTYKDKIWFSGKFWVIREGCLVTEWLDEKSPVPDKVEDAVEFAEWITPRHRYNPTVKEWQDRSKLTIYTTKQLYEIFKNKQNE